MVTQTGRGLFRGGTEIDEAGLIVGVFSRRGARVGPHERSSEVFVRRCSVSEGRGGREFRPLP